MRLLILIVLVLTVSLTSCVENVKNQDEKPQLSLEDSIAKLEDLLFNSEQNKLAKKTAAQLVDAYITYAKDHPQDSVTADYLFKAADISMNLNRPNRTIQLFDEILKDHPNYRKTPSALFLKAFVYEDQLKDLDKAKKYYELFLVTYPDSEFADDAEVSLKNLGKTPEELIREFEQNKK